MPLPHSLPKLLAAVFLVVGLVSYICLPADAKGKKSKRITAHSKSKSNSRKTGQNVAEPVPYQTGSTVPDSIEVIENGSANSAALKRLLNPPLPPKTFNTGFASDDPSAQMRHLNVRMETSRVIEIQQALTRRGFFQSETTGVYDEATIDAMRRFQTSEKIPVTGYPTAHALKRLWLAN